MLPRPFFLVTDDSREAVERTRIVRVYLSVLPKQISAKSTIRLTFGPCTHSCNSLKGKLLLKSNRGSAARRKSRLLSHRANALLTNAA